MNCTHLYQVPTVQVQQQVYAQGQGQQSQGYKGFTRHPRTSSRVFIALTIATVVTAELIAATDRYITVRPEARLPIDRLTVIQPIAANRVKLGLPIRHSNSDNSFGQ